MTEQTQTSGVTTPSRGEAVVEAKDVVAGYLPGVNILNGCSLVAYPGEMIGIIGPNGAGKSTLLKAMFGLVRVHSGQVTLHGKDITNLKANRLVEMGVGFVPQTNNVFPTLTIEENLRMGLFMRPQKLTERLAAMWDLFPVLHDRQEPARRRAVGRRASVVGDGPGADDGALGAAARRAVGGPVPGPPGRDVPPDPPHQQDRCVRGHGRAERPPVPADLRPRLRARPGSRRLHRHRPRAGQGPQGHRPVPRHPRRGRRPGSRPTSPPVTSTTRPPATCTPALPDLPSASLQACPATAQHHVLRSSACRGPSTSSPD